MAFICSLIFLSFSSCSLNELNKFFLFGFLSKSDLNGLNSGIGFPFASKASFISWDLTAMILTCSPLHRVGPA